jgi:hypothetical protein
VAFVGNLSTNQLVKDFVLLSHVARVRVVNKPPKMAPLPSQVRCLNEKLNPRNIRFGLRDPDLFQAWEYSNL